MTETSPAAARVTRDTVLDTAMRLVRESGVQGLSMRKLAAELGVAVTSIYWHVGNREALVDHLVARVVHDMDTFDVTGDTPVARVVSIAESSRRMILERPHLIGLVRERGQDALMMLPARRALVHEVTAAGLHGVEAATAVQAVQHMVAGFVMLERAMARHGGEPEQMREWRESLAAEDPEMAAHLTYPTNAQRLFTASIGALVESLLRTASR